VCVCRYLREKDHFERQYKKHLSKRLLANKPPAEGGSHGGGVGGYSLGVAFPQMACLCSKLGLFQGKRGA
jgi:hypothetical protein